MKKRNYYGFDDWANVVSQFEAGDVPEPDFVYAIYSTPAYEGHATVIFRRGNEWFEAGGGHCSCYGLEGQWTPAIINPATHLEALKQGRKELLVSDSEGDYPDATQENFDAWLRWAVRQ